MLALIALFLVLNSTGLSPTGVTAGRMFNDATRNLSSAVAVHYEGSFVSDTGEKVRLDLTVSSGGDSQGSLARGGRRVELVATGSDTYLRGRDYWATADARMAKVYGDSWVRGSPASLGVDVASALAPSSLARALRSEFGDERSLQELRKAGSSVIRGSAAVRLSGRRAEFYVTSTEPFRLVRLVSPSGLETASGDRDFAFDLAYPAGFQAAQPSPFIDPADPRTLPARYTREGLEFGRCGDASGCEVKFSVRNRGGQPVGQSTASVNVSSTAGADLGACSVNLPAIAYNETAQLSCRVSGPAWSAFARGAGTRTFQAQLEIVNPPYDS